MPKSCVHMLAALLFMASGGALAADEWTRPRAAMIEEIADMTRAIGSAAGGRRVDDRVMAAMARVPRHAFVPDEQRAHAYENRPLPIGHGQTISQPYIVAVMTELLAVGKGARVLEIGTGSGYQAAVLAEMGATVFSIEIIEPLASRATRALSATGYREVRTRAGDGYYGWPEHGPFDAIIVTAAAGHVPPPLVQQLKPGGRLVIPVGPPFLAQHLVLVQKASDGSVTTRQLLPVRFVPLTGGH